MTAETATPSSINEPNATLYVSNIDWKIKKPILRRALHTLFSRHGKILEIITLRKQGLRGQAWVVFSSVATATAALQAEQNFTFFDKNLKIAYAKEKSDRVAKIDGTFVPKDRRKAKREREAKEAAENAKRMKLEGGSGDGVTVEDPSVLVPSEGGDINQTSATQSSSAAVEIPPSNILFAESLPKDCTEMMLACLFRSYPGYKEVRMPRSGLAFIEFDDEPQASVALKALDGFNLSETEALNLKYGKA
mmetsp:Transcript_11200/g.14130  ORF Transcript_11200/g.14130 Transcript_11200/m.14130 type:complete len:249 (+) Transcript_11200:127-873(+)|eukprot:CAMPEP_0203660788 /NCGR_PEP_ID=MMETSP0088-20131115/57913_1 /ASSEMBLY_ACC=CAM_ASM_001087 /TAXON_ID=426623 /ORGANISM="Chaetoceros affinis, Strain CCMP159" /LENGTH=248 /DNA_ID=CAMNT_0050523285 /DNA_START=151 /DNA_END=897 /DNA_ORIENTATION=+